MGLLFLGVARPRLTCYTQTVDIKAGTEITLALTDSSGCEHSELSKSNADRGFSAVAYSSQVTIAAGTSSSCLSDSSSSSSNGSKTTSAADTTKTKLSSVAKTSHASETTKVSSYVFFASQGVRC